MTSCGNEGSCDAVFSYPMFQDLERQQSSFTGIAAHRSFNANLAYKGQTLKGDGLEVSGSYFPVLGLNPARGRLIDDRDTSAPGEGTVVVLTFHYWRTRFNLDPAVIGEPLIVNGHPLTIVGVAPDGFDGTTIGARPDVFVPVTMAELMQPGRPLLDKRRAYWIYLFARLKPGVTIDQARPAINQPYRAILNDVEAPLQTGMPPARLAEFKARQVQLDPGARGQSDTPEEAFVPLVMLLGVTCVVLLIACANIANLLLARATSRSGEMAVRLSIGAAAGTSSGSCWASRAPGGAGGGLRPAGGAVDAGRHPAMLPEDAGDLVAVHARLAHAAVSGRRHASAPAAVRLVPGAAQHAAEPGRRAEGAGGAARGRAPGQASAPRWRRRRSCCRWRCSSLAGLFLKSLVNITRVDLGIKTDHVVDFGVSPEINGYTAEQSKQFFERLEDELARLPGVTGVTIRPGAAAVGQQLGQQRVRRGFHRRAGYRHSTRSSTRSAPDYFRTLGVPVLIAGREFTRADTMGAPKVALVNEAFAKKFGLGRDAVGRRMEIGNGGKLDIEIVGLVKNAKYSEVKQEVPPLFFPPYRQDDQIGTLVFYLAHGRRTGRRDARHSADAGRASIPRCRSRTCGRCRTRRGVMFPRTACSARSPPCSRASPRFSRRSGSTACWPTRWRSARARSACAWRLAPMPGASAAMVLRQVAWMTLVGAVVGLGLAMGAGWALASQLYQMTGLDPGVFAGAVVVLAAVAFGAGFIPAHRASRVDPMMALRYE